MRAYAHWDWAPDSELDNIFDSEKHTFSVVLQMGFELGSLNCHRIGLTLYHPVTPIGMFLPWKLWSTIEFSKNVLKIHYVIDLQNTSDFIPVNRMDS